MSLTAWVLAWLKMTAGWGGDGPGSGLVEGLGMMGFTVLVGPLGVATAASWVGVRAARGVAWFLAVLLTFVALGVLFAGLFEWAYQPGAWWLVSATAAVLVTAPAFVVVLRRQDPARAAWLARRYAVVLGVWLGLTAGVRVGSPVLAHFPSFVVVPLLIVANAVGEHNGTDLWCDAASAGNARLVRALISLHSNPACPERTPSGAEVVDPLFCALEAGHEDLAIALIESNEYDFMLRRGLQRAQELKWPRVLEAIERHRHRDDDSNEPR